MKEKITDQEFEEIELKMVLEFAQTTSAKTLHQMAMHWNGAQEFLDWIVNRPETDKATAMMIYWMSQPRWWKQYRSRQELIESGDFAVGFDFTEALEEKLLAGFFKNQQFAFDPNEEDEGTIWANELLDKVTVRDIPPLMFQPLIGEAVEHPENFEEGKPPILTQKIEEAYDQYDIID